MELFVRALAFASEAHKGQSRLDVGKIPYINHPIDVAFILVSAGIIDQDVLSASVLHDVIEDCGISHPDLVAEFGLNVANLVLEVSDDPDLKGDERKQAQIKKIKLMSDSAKLIKVADKIANLKDLKFNPPVSWDVLQKEKYRDFAKAVFDSANVQNQFLIDLFNALIEEND